MGLALWPAGPLGAGEFASRATTELEAFGAQAGYIVATIEPCGGDAWEIVYFTRQVRLMLEKIGGDAADFAIVMAAMERARVAARPTEADCRDDRAMRLAQRLAELRDAIRVAAE